MIHQGNLPLAMNQIVTKMSDGFWKGVYNHICQGRSNLCDLVVER